MNSTDKLKSNKKLEESLDKAYRKGHGMDPIYRSVLDARIDKMLEMKASKLPKKIGFWNAIFHGLKWQMSLMYSFLLILLMGGVAYAAIPSFKETLDEKINPVSGFAFIDSDPQNAVVEIREKSEAEFINWGTTPVRIKLEKGTYIVKITKDGYDSVVKEIQIEPGKTINQFEDLKEIVKDTDNTVKEKKFLTYKNDDLGITFNYNEELLLSDNLNSQNLKAAFTLGDSVVINMYADKAPADPTSSIINTNEALVAGQLITVNEYELENGSTYMVTVDKIQGVNHTYYFEATMNTTGEYLEDILSSIQIYGEPVVQTPTQSQLKSYTVKGVVFEDLNQNGIKDEGEDAIQNTYVDISMANSDDKTVTGDDPILYYVTNMGITQRVKIGEEFTFKIFDTRSSGIIKAFGIYAYQTDVECIENCEMLPYSTMQNQNGKAALGDILYPLQTDITDSQTIEIPYYNPTKELEQDLLSLTAYNGEMQINFFVDINNNKIFDNNEMFLTDYNLISLELSRTDGASQIALTESGDKFKYIGKYSITSIPYGNYIIDFKLGKSKSNNTYLFATEKYSGQNFTVKSINTILSPEEVNIINIAVSKDFADL